MITTIAFEGDTLLARGSLAEVAVAVRRRTGKANREAVRVFDYATGRDLHLDLSGSEKDVRARLLKLS